MAVKAPGSTSIASPSLWLPALLVGVVAGIDGIGGGLAIASLLFAGPLAAGLGLGVGVVLLAGVVLALGVAWRSTLPNSVAIVQKSTIAILAAATATMAVQLDAPNEVKVATALAMLGIASLATGGLFWFTGRLGLGRLVRFLPYPVVAGFLAGSGWLLVNGAVMMLTGQGVTWALVERLSEFDVLARVLPALLFALVMLAALQRFPHPATAPLLMAPALVVFYALLALMGVGVPEAQAMGHLTAMADGGMTLPTLDLLWLVDWPSVLTAAPTILSVAVLSMIGLLLNLSGLELATGRDIDVNSELRSSGLANLLTGSFGGPSGYVGLSLTILAEKLAVRGRSAGLTAAAVMALGLVLAGPLVSHLPVFFAAGFVLFLGIGLLQQWLVAARRQLPLAEWLIVVVILATVALVGFMEGLAVGLLISAAVFVFNYSRLAVVRLSASGIEQRSAVDRSPAAMKHLSRHGDAIEVVQLQGYLFFGSADRVVHHVRRRLAAADRAPLRFLVLDFRHVSGVDSAATTCFIKIKGLLDSEAVKTFFTHVAPEVERALRQAGLVFGADLPMSLDSDIDHAVERAEEALLADEAELEGGADLVHHLAATVGPHPRLADLVAAMTRLSLQPEDVLITAGEDADDVYFVAQGRVRVQITLPNGRALRLRTMTGGAVVGEIALYLHQKRTADVIVETPASIFRLGVADLDRLEHEDPELAVLAHRLLACNLSEKLAMANRMIQLAQR
jgi:sulfate permease, SulP family